jgi:hypothetical protein
MENDAIMSSSLLIMLVRNEKLEETPIDMNVSQQPREEKPIEKAVRTQVAQSMWDHHMLPNLHVFSIYL